MSHQEQILFFDVVSRNLGSDFEGKKILEIGSFDVNGSVRRFFKNSIYLGVDLIDGPGVDLVADGGTISHPDNSYDLTISSECFEHNPHWAKTLLNMYRMTKQGGLLIFTCASKGRVEHGTRRSLSKFSPGSQSRGWDYYMNVQEKDVRRHLDIESVFGGYFFLENTHCADLYFVGAKIGSQMIFNFDAGSTKNDCIEAQRKLRVANYLRCFSSPRRFISCVLRLPLRLARVLPERQFQFVAVNYSNFIEVTKSKIKDLIQ